MKKNIVISIISVVVIIAILSSLVVSANSKNQEAKMDDKIVQEIDYLDKYLISLLADFKEDSNWKEILEKTERLYSIWNTISLDLNFANIEGKSILTFSDILNETTQNVKKRDKQKCINSIAKIYGLLPQYSQSYKPNSKESILLKIKGNVVKAYAEVENGNWKESQSQLSQASNQFTSLINSVNQDFQNQSTLNQCYVLINELNKGAQLSDKDIFAIQYQQFMRKVDGI